MTTEAKPREEPAILTYFRRQLRDAKSAAVERPGKTVKVCDSWWNEGDVDRVIAHLDRLASGTGERELDDTITQLRGVLECGPGDEVMQARAAKARIARCELENDSLRSDLATAKRELDEAKVSLETEKFHRRLDLDAMGDAEGRLVVATRRIEELESARSQPVAPTGELSLAELRDIAMRGAAKYGHQDEGLRALFDAGVARGEAKRAEAMATIGEVHDSLVCFEHGTNYPHKDLAWCRAELRKLLPAYKPAATQAEEKPACPSRYCSKPSGHDDECDLALLVDKEPKVEPVCGRCVLCGSDDDVKSWTTAAFYGFPELAHQPVCYECVLKRPEREIDVTSCTGEQEQATIMTGPTTEKRDSTPESGLSSAGNGEEEPQHVARAGHSIERLTREELDRLRRDADTCRGRPGFYITIHGRLIDMVIAAVERDLASAEKEGGEELRWRQIREAAEQVLDCVPGYRAERRAR